MVWYGIDMSRRKITNEKKQKAINLLATGIYKQVEVARIVGVNGATLSTWRQRPEFQSAINQRIIELRRPIDDAYRELKILAAQRLRQMLVDGTSDNELRLLDLISKLPDPAMLDDSPHDRAKEIVNGLDEQRAAG